MPTQSRRRPVKSRGPYCAISNCPRIRYCMGVFLLLLMLGLAGLLIVFSEAASSGAREGLALFAGSVLPCLFPFMVCGHYISECGLPRPRSRGKLIGLLYAFGTALICAVCGTPAGALVSAKACSEGMSERRASMLCAALNQTGPLFIIGVTADTMLGVKGLWPVLAAAHYTPCLIAACALGVGGEPGESTERVPPLKLFADSLSEAVSSVLRVGGTIVFFRVLISVFETSGAFAGFGGAMKATLAGALEMTNGLSLLTSSLPPSRLCCAWCAALLSFGGGCVFMQSKLFFGELKAAPYLAVKAALAAASFGLAYLIYPFFGGAVGAGYFPSESVMATRAGGTAALAVCMLFSAAAAFIYARTAVKRRNP